MSSSGGIVISGTSGSSISASGSDPTSASGSGDAKGSSSSSIATSEFSGSTSFAFPFDFDAFVAETRREGLAALDGFAGLAAAEGRGGLKGFGFGIPLGGMVMSGSLSVFTLKWFLGNFEELNVLFGHPATRKHVI